MFAQRRARLSTTIPLAPTPSQILQKTNYDMSTHPPESTDWLNMLFAQIIQGYRNDLVSSGGDEGARVKIERWLNPDGGLSWLVSRPASEGCPPTSLRMTVNTGLGRGVWWS